MKDEIDNIYGNLTVKNFLGKKGVAGHSYWNCECICGNMHKATGTSLRSGKVKMCKICSSNKKSVFKTTHGQSKQGQESGTYKSWRNMMKRCSYEKDIGYDNYGGRGITVCEQWKDFMNFYKDMGDRPEGMSLDRIDVDGNYCKENCKWSENIEQSENTRVNRLIFYDGKYSPVSFVARKLNVEYHEIYYFCITKGMTVEEYLNAKY